MDWEGIRVQQNKSIWGLKVLKYETNTVETVN